MLLFCTHYFSYVCLILLFYLYIQICHQQKEEFQNTFFKTLNLLYTGGYTVLFPFYLHILKKKTYISEQIMN